jgi:hypothetical protein
LVRVSADVCVSHVSSISSSRFGVNKESEVFRRGFLPANRKANIANNLRQGNFLPRIAREPAF